MNKSASKSPRAIVRQILAQSVSIGSTASVGLLMLGSAAARADDVPCQYIASGTGTTCLAQLKGAAGDTPGTTDSAGNGHNGGPGNPTDQLVFSLTDPIQLVDHPIGTITTGPGYSPVNIQNTGGAGGDGYHSDQDKGNKSGGNGAPGMPSGGIQVTLGSGVKGVSSGTNNLSALLISSTGGAGGGSGLGSNLNGTNGTAGVGGNDGGVGGTVDGTWSAGQSARSATIESQGGVGGFGGAYRIGLSEDGGDAAVGGNAGTVTLTLLNTKPTSPDNGYQFNGVGGVLVQSVGGQGGQGGGAEAVDGSQGGAGGLGGNGNAVNLTVGPNVTITASAANDAALHVLSQGGAGGSGGGGGGSGGTAGAGGNANDATLTFQPGSANYFDQIVSAGTFSPGVLVQSLGGAGGGGGSASWGVVGPNGGDGNTGGTPGTAAVTGGSVGIVTGTQGQPTLGQLSDGVLVQSIGGGGGSGSVAKGVFATGGNGGAAVAGQDARSDLTSGITTYGFRADGISVQSIGGGGGVGGEAYGDSVGLQAVVGGTGGKGGAGGTAELTSEVGSTIVTFGDHASGLVVQSIGGGGGNGGAAYSGVKSALIGVDISVGGTGGPGGDGSTVDVVNQTTNAGVVATFGSDSFGILAQSVGGGGGVGGASTARAKVYGDDDLPSVSLTEAIGGNGATAGTGNSVNLGNTGLVTTSGAGATGIVGQSIGGGGGTGGDAKATSSATDGDFNFSGSVAIGGKGGTAGDGGTVTATNSGLVVTLGESADGLLVQSVGGGGGIGGSGDAKASSSNGELNLSTTLTMGGNGGGGGDGHSVTATNSGGSIITLGDGAAGIAAQAIGGGGGRAGGGAGSTKGDFTASYTVGGQGGTGGGTFNVDSHGNPLTVVAVNNTAGSMVMTYGADATGILAQSIGGAGGDAGKSATTLGKSKSTGDGGNSGSGSGPNPSTGPNPAITQALADFSNHPTTAVNNYNTLSGAETFVTSLLSSGSGASAVADDDPLDDLAQSGGETDDDNESTKIHLQVAVGGAGGTGGGAGSIQVKNDGTVVTLGAESDGIIAQAVGGGGGKGGAASTATSNDYEGSLDVGGTGGSGGNGGQPVVTNTGSIITEGALSSGIVAQSIGGGGGIGGISAASTSSSSKNSGNSSADDGAFKNIPISVGGNGQGGISGSSGQVYVTSSGAIATTAHDSTGIIAQSIAGGGGIVKTLATDLEKSGGSSSSGETDYDINFKFGGQYGSAIKGYDGDEPSGSSGLVNVTTTRGGTITTQGDDSYGILAQSIAGGGGLALGGKPVGTSGSDFFGSGMMYGSVTNDGVNSPTSGNSGLFVEAGDNITTGGNGAIGILAQSIGGGGGLAGDTGATTTYAGFGSGTNHNGSGGYVNVTVDNGATVLTTGQNAPAVFVQSIGGGGGRVTNKGAAYIGTAGGTGTGGAIDININGTVQATGLGSAGVFAQSQGDAASQSPINVTVGSTGRINVGAANVATSPDGESAGIYIDHGGTTVTQGGKTTATQNTVTNNGVVQTYGPPSANGVAVYSTGGNTNVINSGTMNGDVLLTNGGGTGCFSITGSGSYGGGDKVTVGPCGVTNAGTFNVGSAGAVSTTTISGDYVQQGSGKLNIDADLKNGKADTLAITGKATISGVVNVNALTVSNKSVAVLTATGGVSVDPHLKQVDNSALFDFPVVASGNELDIKAVAHFNDLAANLGTNQKKMASYLQELFDTGAPLDDGFTALSRISTGQIGNDYAASLRSMSGEALGAFGAFRVNSSQAFANNLYQGCRELTFDSNTSESCSWARISGDSGDQSARDDLVGYHASAYTIEIGGQVGLSDKLALVGSLGSEQSQFQGDDGTSQIKGSAAVAGVGLNFANGPLELSGALDAAYGWYRSYRTITVGDESQSADATPRQWQLGLHVRGAYEIPFASHTYFKPFVEGHAIRVTNESFTEDGSSPFRLAVDSRADTALVGGTGIELGAHFPLHFGGEFHPFISAAAEFGQDVQWTTTAHFANQPTGEPAFDTRTAGPGTLGRFAIGADLLGTKNLTFSLLYSPEVGSGYSSQGGTARISYAF